MRLLSLSKYRKIKGGVLNDLLGQVGLLFVKVVITQVALFVSGWISKCELQMDGMSMHLSNSFWSRTTEFVSIAGNGYVRSVNVRIKSFIVRKFRNRFDGIEVKILIIVENRDLYDESNFILVTDCWSPNIVDVRV
jgi:hypothetical protein